MNFETFLTNMETSGFMDVVIPFVIIFSLVYLILRAIRQFGKGPNIALSIVMGAIPVILHVLGRFPPCWDVIVMMNNSMTWFAKIMIALLVFFVIIGLFGLQLSFFSRALGWIAIASGIVMTYIMLNSRGPGCDEYRIDIIAWIPYGEWILAGLIFLFVMWLMLRSGREGGGHSDLDIY